MESKSKKSNLPLIRRCLAIGLVLLSIMFLFWPTTVAVSSRLRSSRIDDRAVQYINRYDCSESQAKTIAELELVDSFRGASILDLRGRLTYYALRQSIEDANKKETHGEDWFDDYLDRLSEQMMWVLSEYYSKNLSKEVRKGHREVALKGLHNGGPGF